MQNRIRYLLLFTMSLVFFLSAIPAVNAFEGISAGNFQMEENSPGAADLEIKTYQDIPYTGQFPASVGEAGGEVSVVKQPRKGTVVLDGDKFTYMPKAGKTGADRFTYAVTNAEGVTSAPATVSIQIEKRRSQVTYSDMEGNSGYSLWCWHFWEDGYILSPSADMRFSFVSQFWSFSVLWQFVCLHRLYLY